MKRMLLYNFVQKKKKSRPRKTDDASASSSSAPRPGNDKYDVFLSFSGKGTHKTFVDHLYNSFVDAGVYVFRDNNELRERKKISTNVYQAIKNSKISIAILSQNYASSKWCLQELVEMIECIRSGHVVLPIFYHVKPLHVRNQIESFGEAFSRVSGKYVKEDVVKWKYALQAVASLKGWESQKNANRDEGKLVRMVVESVLRELKKSFQLVVTEKLVGVDNTVEDILRLLDNNPNATQVVGIHGMGGIGKTTLAKVIYNKLSDQFEHRSFIADIRESSRRKGILDLQNLLIYDILKMKHSVSNADEMKMIMEFAFKCKKVLILLDDVDDNYQIKALVGKYDCFGMGSKIIITTRMKSVLDAAGVNCKYELKEIAEDKSLILFSRHAFRRDSPPSEFESLSHSVVSIAKGLPLILEVIGSLLCGKRREYWLDALEKLQKVPHAEVQEKLLVSYDALSWEEREIFLDIACFFIGADVSIASYMWEACNFFPNMAIETLTFMSLIKIGDGGELKMHDQLRDLGREIVRREDYNTPMNRSRLWVHEEALAVLQRNKGVQKYHVRALYLEGDCSQMELTTEQFETLPNLRFLAVRKAELIGDSRSLLPSLLWLTWTGYPAFVATSFCLKKLVILDLSKSNISELWEGWSHLKVAKQLKVLNLADCDSLKITPDLSGFRNLEILVFSGCYNLKRIHPSIGEAKSLLFLILQDCIELQELPQEMDKLEELKELQIGRTAIKEIPPCIGWLKKLEMLNAHGCKSLIRLPNSISHLENLSTLDLRDCFRLCRLPKSIGSLVKLQSLSLGGRLERVEVFRFLQDRFSESNAPLVNDDLVQVLGLDKLEYLEELQVWDCQSLVRPDLSQLTHLKRLSTRRCRNLVEIKGLERLKILEKLDIEGCRSIEKFPDLSCFDNLEDLDIRGCSKLQDVQGLEKVANVLK